MSTSLQKGSLSKRNEFAAESRDTGAVNTHLHKGRLCSMLKVKCIVLLEGTERHVGAIVVEMYHIDVSPFCLRVVKLRALLHADILILCDVAFTLQES